MSAALSETLADAEMGVAVAETPEALAAIHRPDCAAVLWRRQPAPSALAWLDALDPDLLPSARIVLEPSGARDAVAAIFEAHGAPDCAERDHLVDDIAALATRFAELLGARSLRLRLDVIETNACRKFHVDAVIARLVCTYRGSGTQYGVAQGGGDPARIFAAPTGAPIILRGMAWPNEPPSALRHRSPPIEGTGETRLVLVLDPIFDAEDEA